MDHNFSQSHAVLSWDVIKDLNNDLPSAASCLFSLPVFLFTENITSILEGCTLQNHRDEIFLGDETI